MTEEQPEIDDGELPARPRRRMLTPLPLTLLALLAIACGFIAGVLVEKGQGDGSTGGSGAAGAFASRIAALRGGSASGDGTSSSSSAIGSRAAGGAAELGGAAGGSRSGAGATIGQVAYVSRGALYVTTLEGNTVKVTAAQGATVTKSVKTSAAGIHPGETVVVTGAAGANGAIAAASIRAGAAGAGGLGGAAALLGGLGRPSGAGGASGGSGGASGGSGGASGGSGGGEQALFGKG